MTITPSGAGSQVSSRFHLKRLSSKKLAGNEVHYAA
jgi:hypothetical protein